MKDIKISHIRTEPILPILPQGVLWGPESDPSRTSLVFRTQQTPLGQNRRNRHCTYVRNFDIFHLRPVPSKNIENCTLKNFLKFRNLKKYTDGDFPKMKNGKTKWFQKSLGIILMVILSYYLGNLGVKSRHGVT